MNLQWEQQQQDEERVACDEESEADHSCRAQLTSNGYKVSVVTLFYRPCT